MRDTNLKNFGTNPAVGGAPCSTTAENSERPEMREPLRAVTFERRRSAGRTSRKADVSLPLEFPWGAERRQRLQQICQAIGWQREKGIPLRHAVREFVRRWDGRSYLVAPDRKLKLSEATLLRLYYEWVRKGRSDRCFAFAYTARLATVTMDQARRLLKATASSRAASLGQAARFARIAEAIARRVFTRLPRRVAWQVNRAFEGRHHGAAAVQRAVENLQGELRRQLVAEQRRGRGLRRLADAFGAKRVRSSQLAYAGPGGRGVSGHHPGGSDQNSSKAGASSSVLHGGCRAERDGRPETRNQYGR